MAKMKFSKTVKKTSVGILSGLATGFLIYLISLQSSLGGKYIEQIERVFYDLTFKYQYSYGSFISTEEKKIENDSTLEQRIQIVDIDERALSKLGSYNTWPRTNHATAIDYLTRGGAASVTFDILFKTADFGESNAKIALDVMKNVKPSENWEAYYPAIRSSYNYDSVLVQSVQDAGNVVVCALLSERKNYDHKTQWEPLSTTEWQNKIGISGTLNPDKIPLSAVKTWDLLDDVFPDLAQATTHLGLVNVVSDDDGVHRKEPLFHAFPNPEVDTGATPRYYPVISIQTASLLFGIKPNDIIIKPGEYVDLGQPLGISKDSLGQMKTTYPNLTWIMVREVIRKKAEILALGPGNNQPKKIEICHPVVVDRNSDGSISADINDAQTLDNTKLSAILNTPKLDSLWSEVKHTHKVQALNAEVALADDSTGAPKIIGMVSNDTITMTNYGLEALRSGKAKIDALARGKRLYLSSSLDIKYDSKRKRLSSSFIILMPSVLSDLLKQDLAKLEAMPSGTLQRFGHRIQIPVDNELRMQVNYTGNYDTKRNQRPFTQLSYYDVVKHRIDAASFQGKVFVLGSTSPALFDLLSAPHESQYPGVMIHATILENILNENFLRILDNHTQLWVILALALLCALLASLVPPLVGIIFIVLIICGYFLAGLSYFSDGYYIGMARQLLTVVLCFIELVVIRYVFENREKRFLDKTFKQYISPELIDMMVESEQKPSLGGKEIYATAFFTDIAGFSSFSEAIGSPERLVELLNEYLGDMTNILTSNRGTLDKYIGDAIVAIFGAPVEIPDHSLRACEVALKMQQRLKDLRVKWKSEGDKWPLLVQKMHMRIGINTGNMVVGNMGSAMRMNYTMMGDTVNLAARLESASKQYGVYIQVADETLKLIEPRTILSRSMDLVVVMGKTEPVLCHELLALKEDITPELEQLVSLWEQARAAYIATQWDRAIALFEQCLAFEPHHPDRDPGSKITPSHVYLKRCQAFKENPPVKAGETWNGVYVATSK